MIRTPPAVLGVLAVALLLVVSNLAATAPHGAEEGAGGWVCPPCVHSDLDAVYDEPGACPVCGMELVARDELVYAAILVFDGVQIIDYTAPYEVFGQADFYTYLVSPDGEPIATTMDMHVTPHFAMGEAPRPDVLLVPGGDVGTMRESDEVLEWVRATAAGADHVLSVCNGAFILAQAGLLDGLGATTFHRLLDDLAMHFPAVDVVRGVRFVDNGKIVTSAGLSAGIDAAIHLVEKIQGREAAERLAAHIEYAWDPDAAADPEPVGRELADDEVHAYDGLYELAGGGEAIVRGSPEDRLLYAWIGDDRYPLLPIDGDRFRDVGGDDILFLRAEGGEVIGYREVGEEGAGEYRRLGDVPEE